MNTLGETPEALSHSFSAESFWHGVGTAAVVAFAALITYWGIKAIVTGKNPLKKAETQHSLSA